MITAPMLRKRRLNCEKIYRAKSAQDKREAWAEYNRELKDARKDYTKEMVERGYILRPRGEVIVGE